MSTLLNAPVSPGTRTRSIFAAVGVLVATTLLGACFSVHEAEPEDGGWGDLVVYDEAGWPLSEAAIDAHVTRLDAQIAYLSRELDVIEGKFEAARDATGESAGMSELSRLERTRYRLLLEMYEERVREYETMRLEQVAAAVMR